VKWVAKKIAAYKKHREMEDKLQESEEKYRLLFEFAYDGILLIDGSTVVDCNQRAADIFGCPRHEIQGSSVERFMPALQSDDRNTRELISQYRDIALQGEPRLFEIELCRCDGSIIEVELSLNYINFHQHQLGQVIVRDITTRKQMEDWLRYLNMHDKPTGLYNRNYFEEEMQRMQTGRFDPVGVVVCDVDGLKAVNDNLGHGAGDALLAAAARILMQSFRESDVVARIGGDEFAILLPNCSTSVVESACTRIRENVIKMRNSKSPVPISLSVGWAVKMGASQTMVETFKEADNNMYLEKPANRAQFKDIFTKMLPELKELQQSE
jgi:diguanylate cyclase (GGDEF)-like protein/PAS domain S-box-containing protein